MRIVVLAFVFLCSFIISAKADEIKIGVAGPMTGGMAAFGEQIQHGAQLAAEEINQQGGLLGKKLSVFTEDDACDPKQARNIAAKMATEKAVIVFGHWCSGPSMAASGVYGEEGILQIDVGGLLEKLTQQGFPTIFRVSGTSKSFAEAIGVYTVKHNPAAKVAIITDQPAVTKELAQELTSYFATTKNQVVAVEDIQGGDKDFSSVIDKLKELQPQVVICSCYTIEAALLARQLAEKKLDVSFYSWDTLNSPDFLSIIANTDTSKIVSIDYSRAPESGAYKKLAGELRKHQWPVETTTILTYAAFQVFIDAVKTANSFDAAKIAAVLHDKTFMTVLGDMHFTKNGDRLDPAFTAYQWVNGKLTVKENLSH